MSLLGVLLLALLCAVSGKEAFNHRALLQKGVKTDGKKAASTKPPAAQVFTNTDFPLFSTLATLDKTKTLDDCEDACRKTKGCLSFTRIKGDRRVFFSKGSCFLFSGIGRKRDALDADSGILPPNVEKSVECISLKGISFLGASLADGNNLVVNGTEECCLRCQEKEGCVSYTYLEDSTCWLRATVGKQFPCETACDSGIIGKNGDDTSVLDFQSADPQPPEGEWDFVVTGLLGANLFDVWEEAGTPRDVLWVSFRHMAFSIEGEGAFTLELPSGEEFRFGDIKTNKDRNYHVFRIQSHTGGIVQSESGPIRLFGSELFIHFIPHPSGHTRVNFGMQIKVEPKEVKSSIVPAFEAFLKSLIFNMKLKFGSGNCLDDPIRREVSGACNNPDHPSFGAANIPLKRLKKNDPAYADGKRAPSGPVDISPRYISNMIADEGSDDDDAANKLKITDAHVFFGQFLDHDIGLSPIGAFTSGRQPFFSVGRDKFGDPLPIPVPEDDEYFTGDSSVTELKFLRSIWVREDNKEVTPRRHLNQLTSYLDLGQVYGSEHVRAKFLKSFKDGKLKTNSDGFLPLNGQGKNGIGFTLGNAPNPGPEFYIAGDIRANEVVGLVAMHALWMKEHNLIAEELAKASKGKLKNNKLFAYAKDIAIAEYQSIVYKEYLPLILGKETLDPNDWVYDNETDASADGFFTTVSFRFGHSMVNNFEWKVKQGTKTPVKKPSEKFLLRDLFFKKAGERIGESSFGDWIRGMIWHQARENDVKMVSEMRNFLFTKDPKKPSMDLTSMNIQRAREFGLPMYNAARDAFGLKKVKKFTDVTCKKGLAATLEKIYPTVDDIDPFIGGLAECPSSPDRLVGDLFHASIKETFRRFRDGDRLFYKGFQFNDEMLEYYPRIKDIVADKVTLKDIMLRNTDSKEEDFAGRGNVMWLN